MKIVFISVGAVKKGYIREGVREYTKRIKRYVPFEDIEVREGPYGPGGPVDAALAQEAAGILKKIKNDDYVIVLSDRGRMFSSGGFAGVIERIFLGGRGRIVFVTGGPFGLPVEVSKRANLLVSLSPMTLPHELARLFLAEQVYRALTIIRGEPYSH